MRSRSAPTGNPAAEALPDRDWLNVAACCLGIRQHTLYSLQITLYSLEMHSKSTLYCLAALCFTCTQPRGCIVWRCKPELTCSSATDLAITVPRCRILSLSTPQCTPSLSHRVSHTKSLTPSLSHRVSHTKSLTPSLSHQVSHTKSLTPSLSSGTLTLEALSLTCRDAATCQGSTVFVAVHSLGLVFWQHSWRV